MLLARFGMLPLIVATTLACDNKESRHTGVASSQPTAAETALPAAAAVVPAAPRDLELAALQRDLGCDKSGHPKACRLLKNFAQAQRFTAHTPSGAGRWIGAAVTVEQGVESAHHLVLWCQNVPLSQVGPGDLPVKSAFDVIPDGLKLQSEKLMRALTRAADPPESNPAYQFAHAYLPKTPGTLVNTAGPSVYLASERPAYLRFAPPRKVYLVSLAGTNAMSGDGTYAELWLGDW